jgi:putative flippase GtrA
MTPKLQKFIQHQAVRYIFIGGIAYLIELTALYFFAVTLSLGPTLGVAISFWIGLIVSFTLQKIFSFKNKAENKKHLSKQMLSYGTLVAFNYLFTLAFVSFFEPHIGLFIARTIALLITTVWNFYIYSRYIFKSQTNA